MKGREFSRLRAFATIIECGSFASAAARLGVTPSALSQTIRNLEAELGVRVLNRTTRSVSLTQAGTSLLARVQPAFKALDDAVEEVNNYRDRPAGFLRINVPWIVASVMLAPIIGRFLADYPDIVLEVTAEDTLTDIVAAGYDAGIRLGRRLEQDMHAVPLGGPLRQVAVASPAYIEHHGYPETPQDLHRHRCINWRKNSNGPLYRWQFEKDDHPLEVSVSGPLIGNDPDMVLRAAADGVGIAYPAEHLAAPYIQAGELIPMLEDWSPSFPGMFLYYPERRQMPAALRAFIDYLRVELASVERTNA